jgi:hypothetical protein
MKFDKRNWFTQSLFTQISEARNATGLEVAAIVKNVLTAIEQKGIKLTPEQEEDLKLQVCMNALDLINASVVNGSGAGTGEDDFYDLFGISFDSLVINNKRRITVNLTFVDGDSLEVMTSTTIDSNTKG